MEIRVSRTAPTSPRDDRQPAALNAMTRAMMADLARLWDELERGRAAASC
jgi:hypothetical protein